MSWKTKDEELESLWRLIYRAVLRLAQEDGQDLNALVIDNIKVQKIHNTFRPAHDCDCAYEAKFDFDLWDGPSPNNRGGTKTIFDFKTGHYINRTEPVFKENQGLFNLMKGLIKGMKSLK